MHFSMKRATGADWRELRSIRLRALQSDPSVFEARHQDEVTIPESTWRSRLDSDDAAVFIIYDDASVVGMTEIVIDRNDSSKKKAIMWGSWLEPCARGLGLSNAMYKERIAWASAHPTIGTVVVSHRASNLVSKSANQRHGFKYTHSEAKIWPDGGVEDNIFYLLNIKAGD